MIKNPQNILHCNKNHAMLQMYNFNAFCQFLREIIMSNEMLTKMSEQYQTLLNPVIKANKLSAANLEALVNFQMNSLQSYVDMAMARMKAAADISDPARRPAAVLAGTMLV